MAPHPQQLRQSSLKLSAKPRSICDLFFVGSLPLNLRLVVGNDARPSIRSLHTEIVRNDVVERTVFDSGTPAVKPVPVHEVARYTFLSVCKAL
jgi:hypothetical protein